MGMKVSLEKFNDYISQYVRGHIVPQATKNSTLFKIGMAYKLGLLSVDKEKLEEMKSVGIVDADNNVDVDKLRQGVEGGLDMAGELYIDKLNITLYKSDLDKFFHLVETGAL